LRVLLDGNLIYFGKTHIKYAIPAIIVVTISILPPSILLLKPMVDKCDGLEQFLERCLPLTKIKHFLDEFYSCYRPKFCWYASVYFFYRIALFSSSCFTLLAQQYILQQLLCTIFLVIHSIAQPYTSRLHNCIDGMILGVLLALSCLQGQLFLVSHDIIEDHWPSEVIGVILACIPLAYLIVYVSYIIGKYCYTAYKEVNLDTNNNVLGEDHMLGEWHNELYEEDDIRNPPPQDLNIINNVPDNFMPEEQHDEVDEEDDVYITTRQDLQINQQRRQSNNNYQPLVDDTSPGSVYTTPQVSFKYGTFPDQPD